MKDGGYAFPQPSSPIHFEERGMSLRDYFAAAALQALLSNVNAKGSEIAAMADQFAIAAYGQADAMLTEREKERT